MTDHPLAPLTARQREIVLLRLDGLSVEEVAQQLGISYRGVSNTCMLVRDRLGSDDSPGSYAWLIPLAREVGRWEGREGVTP